MRNHSNPKFTKYVQDRVARAQEASERGDFKAAIGYLRTARSLARDARTTHPFVSWALAVACDNAGEAVDAFRYICEALDQDPTAPAFHRSFGIIVGNLREHFKTKSNGPERAEEAEALYLMLCAEGVASETCHLYMALRWLCAEQYDKVEHLLAAVTTLYPASCGAWEMRAEALRAMGRVEEAATCEAQALALRPEPVGTVERMGVVSKAAKSLPN